MVSLKEGVSPTSILQLMLENNWNNRESYEMYKKYHPHVSYEAFVSTIIKTVKNINKGVDTDLLTKSMSVADGHIMVRTPSTHKSLTEQYRDEVRHKLAYGQLNFENTTIPLSLRDMYSVLAEFGITPMTKPTGYSVNHINWYHVNPLIENLKAGRLTMGEFVRKTFEVLGRDVGVTTLKYKLKECGFNKKMLAYDEIELANSFDVDDISDEIKREFGENNFLTGELFKRFSFGEISKDMGISLKAVYEAYMSRFHDDKEIRVWVGFINKHNMGCVEYRVGDIEGFKSDMKNLPIKDVSVKYKIPVTTLRDWKRKN